MLADLSLIQLLWVVLSGGITLFLPGLAVHAWVPRAGKDFPSLAADTLALSVSLTALAALGTFITNIHLSSLALAVIYALLALTALTGWLLRTQVEEWQQPWKNWKGIARPRPFPTAAVLTVLLGVLLIAWRLYQARALAFPAWVDSIHHTLITRVILEQGRLPNDLLPYLPVPLFYHFGFHSLAAVFTALTHLEPDQSVLLLGQVLNAAVSLAVYRLTQAAWQDWRKSITAALLTACAFTMPAYYVTWGRYTLLTGLLLLPPAMAATLEWSRAPRRPEALIRLGLLTAGILLCHYLAALLLAFFLAAVALEHAAASIRRRSLDLAFWYGLAGSPFIGLVLAAPWIARIWQYSRGAFRVTSVIDAVDVQAMANQEYIKYLGYLIGPAQRGFFLMGLGVLGLLLAGFHKKSRGHPESIQAGWSLPGWTLLLIGLTLPWGLRLGPFRPDHYAIVLFLPAAVSGAHLLISAAQAAARVFRSQAAGWAAGGLAVLLLLSWGMKETAEVINPVTILATQADRAALNWIRQNTPPEARFFINTAGWQGSTLRGADGGAWITTYTGRWALVPAVIYSWGGLVYSQQVGDFASRAQGITTCSDELTSLLKDANLSYLYLRQGSGALQAAALAHCPNFKRVYAQYGVTIIQAPILP